MLDFVPITAADRKWVLPYLEQSKPMCCDFTFGNLFAWSCIENTLIAEKDGFLFVRASLRGVNLPSYSFPLGSGDIEKALFEIENDAKERGVKADFYCLCKRSAELMKNIYGSKLLLIEQRNFFDYIYLRENLANLSGRKYHGQKNHFNSFIKNYNYSFEPITEENIDECLEFSREWHKSSALNPQLLNEKKVIDLAFSHFFELDFKGLVLRVDGKIVAYTAGEPSPDGETFCTHFEKALPGISGSYTAINKLFSENSLSEYKYVNREDDAGQENLRKAKLSYHPEILLEKYYGEIIK